MSHRAERQTPAWWIMLVVLIVLLLGLGAAVYTRTDSVATATTLASDQVDATEAELAAVIASQASCRSLIAQVVSIANRLDHQFHLHHEAHRAMVSGKISQAERNRIWTATLAARVELSALLRQAITQAEARDC